MSHAYPKDLARAFEYPYSWPRASYVLEKGALSAFEPAHRHARLPILAIGSNRSPDQLLRKFGPHARIVVERVRLHGYDVVYAARFSRYGAIPATLWKVQGVSTEVAITWLTEAQVETMHRTEGLGRSYELALLDPACLSETSCPSKVFAYSAMAGALFMDERVWPMLAVHAWGRSLPAVTSSEILEKVCTYLDASCKTADFVRHVQAVPEFRHQCLGKLKAIGRRSR